MVPSGFGVAMPLTADRALVPPQLSSNPSSVKTAPVCTTLTVTTLQYRLQPPVEHAHRLRGRIDGETESGDAGGGEDAADVSHAMSYRQAVQTQQSR